MITSNQNHLSTSRRRFVKNSLALSVVAGIGAPLAASCKSQPESKSVVTEFKQTALSYPYDALEDSIDAMTMEIHYTKHHAGYVKNINAAIMEESIEVTSVEEMLKRVSKFSTKARNNGGGHYNHELFWKNLKPGGGQPSGAVLNEINSSFGSLDAFKEAFGKAAATRFGSGWAWLVSNSEGKLSVGSTPNQDNPLMDISEFKGIPILGLDVWEHAYYLHYQNRRGDYISAFWNVVNWEEVNNRYTSI